MEDSKQSPEEFSKGEAGVINLSIAVNIQVSYGTEIGYRYE